MHEMKKESILFASLTRIARIRLLPALFSASIAMSAGCAVTKPGASSTQADPALAGRYEYAIEARQSGDLGVAEEAFDELADDYPALAEPKLNLAILYIDSDRSGEAEVLLDSIVSTHPDSAIAWNELGILRRKNGQLAAANEAYLQAIDAAPNYALAHRNRGVLLDLYLGQPKEALAHYERYLELSGPDKEVEAWVIEMSYRLGVKVAQQVSEQ
jgi:tetratricopeptide (TPR) repeat protein